MKRNEKRKAGVQAVGELLEHVDAQQRSQLLERLQNQDADLTSHIATSTKDPVAKTNLDKETTLKNQGLKKQRPKIFQKTSQRRDSCHHKTDVRRRSLHPFCSS